MKNSIFLILFLLLSSKLYSQIEQFTYFNKTYSNDSLNILAQVVRPNSLGYIMIGGYSSTGISNARFIAQLDQNGELIWIKNFVEGSEWNVIEDGKFVTETNDGNLVVAIGGIVNSAAKVIHLFKLDQNGNELWHREYENDTIKFIRHIIQTEDGGFALAGVIATQDTAKFLLIKADELGLWQWQRTYSMGNDSRAFSIQQTPWDGGYIIGGWGYSAATGYDMFVVKTLANGDTLWTKRYGGNENDCAAFILPLTTYEEWLNGSAVEYLLSSCIYESGNRKLYLAKLNNEGVILWQKKHTFLTGISGLQVLPIIRQGKSFISSGYYRPDFTPQPFIAAFHANGNVDWVVTPTINSESQVYLKDLQPTPDGGYVLAGYQYSSPQTAWVLKIDSLGNTCSYVGCDSTVVVEVLPGIPSNATPEISALVYPVPASTHLFIRYQIPAAAVQSGGAVWRLYNALGSQWAQAELPGNAGTVAVETSNLPRGLYYYRVVGLQGQVLATGKLAVE